MNRPLLPLLLLAVVAVAVLATTWEPRGGENPHVRLATTTSTRDSGLLSFLLAPWSEETGIEVDVLAVGTGQALEIARRGDADLVLVHARELEDLFVAQGHGIDRRDVMWNDFVLLGPPEDPAGVRGLSDAALAFRRIHAARAPFVSRGDGSGTHMREQALWRSAGAEPAGDAYVAAGQGMGPCLTIADERDAYILADRGTWLAVRAGKRLEVLVEGDPALRNPYGVILVDPARHPRVAAEPARRLRDHLVSPAGQARIGAFRAGGEVLFHPVRGGS